MSNAIQPFGASTSMLARDARRTGRAVSRYASDAEIRTTQVDYETDVALSKVDGLTAVTGHAMGGVVRVAQGQKHLELLAPEASGRLAMLADDHALGCMDITSDHRRALRRK